MVSNRIDVVIVKRLDNGDLELKVVRDFEDELNNIYSVIDCRCIDIITRKIRGRSVDFIVDDEYLLTDKPKNAPTGILSNSPMLEQIYGTFIITGTGDRDGNLTSLSNKDISAIMSARCIGTRAPKDDPSKIEHFDVIAYTL